MKQIQLTFLLTLLMSMVGAKASAYNIAVENADGVTIYYNYINDGTELMVTYGNTTNHNSYSGSVVIPEDVNYNNKTLKVTSIGEFAFNGCSGLTSIMIPDYVTSIGRSAFGGCSGLISITIPSNVTSIGIYAFEGCNSLTVISVDNSNANYSSEDGVLFNKEKNTLIEYPAGKSESYTIPNSVTSIGLGAFANCTSLTSIEIPNSVTSIGGYAFYGCNGLTKINIPEGVTSIGDGAFQDCSSLTKVNIPEGVTSIGSSAFNGCSGLTSVTIPESVTSIGVCAFSGCI